MNSIQVSTSCNHRWIAGECWHCGKLAKDYIAELEHRQIQVNKQLEAIAFAVRSGNGWNLTDWQNWLRFHAQPATTSTSETEG